MAKKKSKSIKGVEGAPYSMPPDTVFVLSSEQLNDTVRRASALKEAELASKYELTPFKEIQRWPDLFVLFLARDGSYFAMLDGKLEERFEALSKDVDDKTSMLIDALSALDRILPESISSLLKTARSSSSPKALAGGNRIHIMSGHEATPLDLERVIELVSHLKEAIGADLHQMHYFRKGQHQDAAKRMIKMFTTAVEAWNRRGLAPVLHGNAEKFPYGSDSTEHSPLRSLPWIAIQVAKELLEKNQRLPEKGDVRNELMILFPELVDKAEPAWTELYKSAGLSRLKRSKKGKYEEEKIKARATKARRQRLLLEKTPDFR